MSLCYQILLILLGGAWKVGGRAHGAGGLIARVWTPILHVSQLLQTSELVFILTRRISCFVNQFCVYALSSKLVAGKLPGLSSFKFI